MFAKLQGQWMLWKFGGTSSKVWTISRSKQVPAHVNEFGLETYALQIRLKPILNCAFHIALVWQIFFFLQLWTDCYHFWRALQDYNEHFFCDTFNPDLIKQKAGVRFIVAFMAAIISETDSDANWILASSAYIDTWNVSTAFGKSFL